MPKTPNQIRSNALMDNIALARIYTLPDATPPKDQLITLSYGQLSELITQAIEKALIPALERIESLQATITGLDARIGLQEDNGLIQLRLIGQLRETTKKVPGKTETSRADKIEKYLASRPDHRASFETLKGNLGVDKARLHEAIKTLMDASPGQYGIIRVPGDKRKRVLVMLPR